MAKFLVKRFIGLIFVILGVTFITFLMGYFAPGDPIRILIGDRFNQDTYDQLKHAYGLDLPWYQQYYNFLVNLVKFNFGTSYTRQNLPVWDLLKDGIVISLELGFWGILLQILIGVPTGILSALKANTWIDTTNMGMALVMSAVPIFITAVFVQIFIGWADQATGGTWPATQWGKPWSYTWTDLQYKIAPILIYASVGIAFYARLARSSMLEVLRQDYIRTARAKGMIERFVIYRHAFRNALIPLVTAFGVAIGFLVTGAFFTESTFSIPGIAFITVQSTRNLDFPVIQATVVILAISVVLGNLLSDILYSIVDPRIKSE